MTFRLLVTPTAEAEIRASYRWLADRSRPAATRWLGRLRRGLESLRDDATRHPEAPEAEWAGAGLRQLLIGRKPHVYRVLFEIEGNTVYVLRVRHGRQDLLRPDDM